MDSGSVDRERADVAFLEVLEMAGVFDDEADVLLTDCHGDFAASLPLAAALEYMHVEGARLFEVDHPLVPVLVVGPVADGVLVRLRLVADEFSVCDGVVGVQNGLWL